MALDRIRMNPIKLHKDCCFTKREGGRVDAPEALLSATVSSGKS